MDVFIKDGQVLDYSALPSVGNPCEDVKPLGKHRLLISWNPKLSGLVITGFGVDEA